MRSDESRRGVAGENPSRVRRETSWDRKKREVAAAAEATGADGVLTPIGAAFVTARFFAAPGLLPLLGRVAPTSDHARDGAQVVVLSHRLWQRRFGGEPRVVGTTLQVDGMAAYVVGVMPPSFTFPPGAELWLPERATRVER